MAATPQKRGSVPPKGVRFGEGQVGNPGGRPKAILEVVELARAHTVDAIRVLHEIATNERAAAVARVAASNSLLERAWGKPVQPIDLTVQNDIAMLIEAGRKRARAEG